MNHCCETAYKSQKLSANSRVRCGSLVALVFFLLNAPFAAGQVIAVFPLLDLTTGPNGVNYTLSEEVKKVVAEQGHEVIDEQKLMDFMVRHRIRTLGRLTTYQVSQLSKELEADLVMIGTVGELKENPSATVSISLQLIRSSDAAIVWANTESIYYSDLISLLALNDPETLADLYTVFFAKLFESLPATVPEGSTPENLLDVNTVVLNPRYVQPDDEIVCKIRLHSPIEDNENKPVIQARVSGKEIPLTLDEDGYYFTATWPADSTAGEQPVSLWGQWPDGTEKEVLIGSYIVDDQAPEVELFLGAKERDGELYFNDRLYIIPKLLDPEPISRWEISVIDEYDEVVVLQSSADHIPRRLNWQGATNTGTPAMDGDYKIIFKVWDRAGWSGSTETEIMLRKQTPDITFEVSQTEESLDITLDNMETAAIDFWWAKFFAEDGHMITLAEGETLPASVSLDLPAGAEENGVECLLVAQDIYGNRTKRNVKNLLRLAELNEEGELLMETEWVEEF